MTSLDRDIVLFDLDGTITDPARGMLRSFKAGLDAVGVTIPPDSELLRLIGPPLAVGFASVGVPARRIDAAIAGYRARYGAGALFDADVYPGMADLIVDLAGEGRVVAIATSKPGPFADRILVEIELRHHVSVVGGATLDGRRSHKVDVIAHTLAELGHPRPDRVVMIGDRAVDVSGGHVHRLATVGVAWGYADPGELHDAEPDALAADATDLRRLLGVGTGT